MKNLHHYLNTPPPQFELHILNWNWRFWLICEKGSQRDLSTHWFNARSDVQSEISYELLVTNYEIVLCKSAQIDEHMTD